MATTTVLALVWVDGVVGSPEEQLLLPPEGCQGCYGGRVWIVDIGKWCRAGLLSCNIVHQVIQPPQLVVLSAGKHPGSDVHIMHALQQSLKDNCVLIRGLSWLHPFFSIGRLSLLKPTSECPDWFTWRLRHWPHVLQVQCLMLLWTTLTASFLISASRLTLVSRLARPPASWTRRRRASSQAAFNCWNLFFHIWLVNVHFPLRLLES